uniref:Uncharacterized protein n=1 Tax=Solanum lycopersicum TaxID=4081 RepID=K4C4I4_SOLLC
MILCSICMNDIGEYNCVEGEGYLVSSLFGREATSVRLASITIGTPNHGGLQNLSIQRNNPCYGVTDAGLVAIAQKLDLFKFPIITDKCLLDIVKNCPDITSLTIYSYSNIGNESLKVVGQYCPSLNIVVLKCSPFIGHHGLAVQFYLASKVLTEVRLQGLCIRDLSLHILFNCCEKIESLSLVSCIGMEDYPLNLVDSCHSSLLSLTIRKFPGIGNTTIYLVGGLCRKLTHIDLSKFQRITNEGLIPLAQNCEANLVVVNLSIVSILQTYKFQQ